MASFRSYEDIEAWQKARQLVKAVYQVSNSGEFARDFSLRDQLRRAVVSVASNIAEGFERDGNKEFRQFLYQAKGSIGEAQTQLYIAWDIGYLTETQFIALKRLSDEIGKMIGGLLRYLANCEQQGIKYRTDAPRNEKPGTRNER